MATKKAPPRRNTDVIRCENCGEEYSTTYKRCPFCDERPGGRSYPPVGGRRVAGGSRSGRGGQPNPLQVAGLVISLVLIIAAVVIVFTTLSPLLFGSTPSGSNSGGASVSTSTGNVTLESLTLSRTDEDQVALQAGESFQLTVTTVPEDAQVTVEWTSSNEDIATVDEYGNITNVYKGSDQVSVTITAAAGGQTASCTILCTGDGTGENIDTTLAKVEGMMRTIVAAFEKQLDSLYGAEALDISTDITVLENMMAREGLVDSPLKAEPDEKKETDIRLEL